MSMVGLLLLLLAQAAAAGPPAPSKHKPASAPPASCQTAVPTGPGMIVVCAERPQGYRLNPDVVKAKRQARNGTGPLKRELLRDTSCQALGAAGCLDQPSINVIQAAAVAVHLVRTALAGGNVGKLFVTDPQLSEYELYLLAKREREEAEGLSAE